MDPADIDDSFKIKVKGKLRWQCNKCEKDYSSKSSLMTHLVGHTGLKPFVCADCGKAFKQLSHLNTHQLRHAGVRPHSCKVCGKSFVQSSHLKRHMNTHNPEKALYCDLCSRKFTYPSELRAHKVKMHGPDRVKKEVHQSGVDLNDTSTAHVNLNNHWTTLPYTNVIPVGELQIDHKNSSILTEKQDSVLQANKEGSLQMTEIANNANQIDKFHQDRTHCLNEKQDKSFQSDTEKLHTDHTSSSLTENADLHILPQLEISKPHTDQPNTSNTIKENAVTSSQIDGQWRCNQCSKIFSTPFELITHVTSTTHPNSSHSNDMMVDDTCAIMMDGVRRWRCRKCAKTYSTKYGLMTHIVDHIGTKPFQCKDCGRGFKQLSHLNTHRLRHQGLRPHRCQVCGKTFVQGSHLKRHMHTHTTQGAFFCDLCPRKFTYPSELRAHKLKAHGPGRHTISKKMNTNVKQVAVTKGKKGPKTNGESVIICPECGKSFQYQSQIDKHMKRHQNIRPHICSECGMQFMEAHHLNQHAFTHTGIKPYQCPVCSRAFTLEANMKRHLLIHSGVRNYECNLCRRRFAQKQTLRAHMITHSNIKPYICKFCGKAFRRNRNLLCHLQLHTNSKPYKCLSCGLRFNRKGNLKKHQKEKHDLDPRMDIAHYRALRVTDNTFLTSYLDTYKRRDFDDVLPFADVNSSVKDQHSVVNHNDTTTDERDNIIHHQFESESSELPELKDQSINEDSKPNSSEFGMYDKTIQPPVHQSPVEHLLQSEFDSVEDIFTDNPLGENDIFNNDLQWDADLGATPHETPNMDNQYKDIQNKPRAIMSTLVMKNDGISEMVTTVKPEVTDHSYDNISSGMDVVFTESRMSRRKGLPRKLHQITD